MSSASIDGAAARETTRKRRCTKYVKGNERVGVNEHTIFYEEDGGRPQRDSYFHLARRLGKLNDVVAGSEEVRRSRAARDAAGIMNRQASEGFAGVSFQSHIYQWACIEAATLKLFPGTDEAAMIEAWRASPTNANIVCTFKPFSIEIVTTLLTLYTAPNTEEINGFACYGIGFGQASAMLGAFSHVYRSMCVMELPSKSLAVKLIMWAVGKKHDAEGGPSFDPATDLEPMFDQLIGMHGDNLAKRIRNCAMLAYQWSVMGRISDVTLFAPRFEDIRWPSRRDAHNCSKNGFPLWYQVTVTQYKGSRKKSKRRILRIFANHLNWKLCPVFWMLAWLELSGIRQGPIFCKFANGGQAVRTFKEYKTRKAGQLTYEAPYDVAGECMEVSQDMWRRVLTKVWRNLTWVDLTVHSVRKSAIKWASRCYGQDWEIKNNSGHADGSTSWYRYIEEGAMDRAENSLGADNAYRRDPIFSVWTWRPVTFTARGR
ncbi:hypothetical protein M885DRAFT_569100 [Pelagophyceae sp. CCMP2097]|nr:hypothetical protein M885DRAFT_569100 [Pelagophyceae sp. CCMP2097]